MKAVVIRVLLLVCVTASLTPLPSLAQGQNQAQAAARFSISGTVVNASDNQPIGGALVDFGGGEYKSAMTSADGRFTIDGAPAGFAQISARHPGFGEPHRPQRFSLAGTVDNLTIKLIPLARISGRVLDRDGEPIESINVQSLVQRIVGGHKEWIPERGASTDENGNFEIDGLLPATYLLRTTQKPLYFVRAKSEASRYIYPASYYPDARTRDLAQHIDLTSGTEQKIDMTLQSVRGARVKVETSPPYPNLVASLQDADETVLRMNTAQADQAGVLTFPAVLPGSWQILAQPPPGGRAGPANLLSGELSVNVGTTDIDHLQLPLATPSPIALSVSGVPNAQPAALQLHSYDGRQQAGPMQGLDGAWSIPPLRAGTYRVVVPINSGPACVTSVLSGAQDLLREALVVTAAQQVAPIQVTESETCSHVTITTDRKDAASIVVVSGNKAFEPRVFHQVTNLAISGLPDGDYQIYAFDDIDDLEYANPDALRGFTSKPVHIEDANSLSVQVDVNQRPAI